ncbi:LysR substrate-binding domain-containing protein [Ammonicoccus fulvus]|uniref:Probable hydrogen peroxide-inducible genes activator n=1 Tax=Ammonicoccus fulvus TaxID=3138240 RepID=A0ABZ3FIX2_9ACTN
MNLRDLEYLVALDEHRHFGRAAAACYASQPTLSTQVRKLETELGVQLIERGARQVLFTPAGEEVVRRARHILAEADDIRDIARQLNTPHTGSVRLGVFPTLGPYLLPHAVPSLGETFPELEVFLTEDKSQELLDLLKHGRLDAAILALPVHDESLEHASLFREDFLLATPVGHDLAGDGEVRSADLKGERLLLLNEGHCLRDQALEFCHAAGAGERDGFRATSLETLRHMVASGVGITLLPQLSVAPPVTENPRIALRRFADPAPHRDLALFWRKTSVYRELMPQIAEVLRESAGALVEPLAS